MLIRQAAFCKGKPFLKGALHCHTTRSDGQGTPEEVIRLHHQNGYDFMALTDHNIFNHENLCPDVPMTMLSGIERDMRLPGAKEDQPLCVHIVGLGVPHDPATPGQDVRADYYGSGQTAQDAQGMIDQLHRWNMRTLYAHPGWSGTTYRDFGGLKGNFAMELWNTGCAIENGLDTDAAYWDEALADGNPLWGVAVDDGHGMSHHCKGWVRVSSSNSAPDILEALERGEFYASCGPDIHDFYVEDGVAHVKCSPVTAVRFVTLRHPLSRHSGDDLTEASRKLPEGVKYVRASVVDAQGRRAWTNPIILR